MFELEVKGRSWPLFIRKAAMLKISFDLDHFFKSKGYNSFLDFEGLQSSLTEPLVLSASLSNVLYILSTYHHHYEEMTEEDLTLVIDEVCMATEQLRELAMSMHKGFDSEKKMIEVVLSDNLDLGKMYVQRLYSDFDSMESSDKNNEHFLIKCSDLKSLVEELLKKRTMLEFGRLYSKGEMIEKLVEKKVLTESSGAAIEHFLSGVDVLLSEYRNRLSGFKSCYVAIENLIELDFKPLFYLCLNYEIYLKPKVVNSMFNLV